MIIGRQLCPPLYHKRGLMIENILYAILMNVFISNIKIFISNIKILLTWKLQCSEGRYIINMQK